jgi:hypothetical protein
MSCAYGWNVQLLLAFESTYGTPPVSGFKKMLFVSSRLGAQQGLIASNVLGLGRDPTQPYQLATERTARWWRASCRNWAAAASRR